MVIPCDITGYMEINNIIVVIIILVTHVNSNIVLMLVFKGPVGSNKDLKHTYPGVGALSVCLLIINIFFDGNHVENIPVDA